MDLISSNQSGVVVEFSGDELAVLANAINESLEALEDWEYPIRVGVDSDAARELLSAIKLARESIAGV
jgi:hypothetical protein